MAKKSARRVKGLKLRGGVWWWRGRVKGRRVWRSTGCRDFDSATRRALDMQRELRDASFGWQTDCPTWEAWVKTYTATHMKRKASRTQVRDAQTLAHALPFFTGRPLNTIRQTDCLKYLHARRLAHTSNPGRRTQTRIQEGTVQRERRFLQAVFQKAVLDGHLATNPWVGIKAVPDKTRSDRLLTGPDEVKLRARLRPRFNRFITFLLQTGLRLDEVRGIDPQRDVRSHQVTVRRKGGKTQDIPLTELASHVLAKQLKADGHLWTQNPQRLREVLALAAKRAGIPHLSPHDLRHTFGHRWLVRGGDIYALSRLLGHKSVTVTEKHYAYLGDADLAVKLRAVMERAPAGTSDRAADTVRTPPTRDRPTDAPSV